MLQVNLIDHKTGKIKKVIVPQNLIDYSFTRILNGLGKAIITFIADEELYNEANIDDFLEAYTLVSGKLTKFETYFVRMKTLAIENGVTYYGIGGSSLNDLLTRRILDVDTDPLALSGYVTMAGFGGDLIETIVTNHFISSSNVSRNIPNFTINKYQLGKNEIGIRKRYDSIFDICHEIATTTQDVDFEVVRVSGNSLALNILDKGVNLTKNANFPNLPYLTLTPNLGVLSEAVLTEDYTEEKNFLYLLGEGDELNQSVTKYGFLTYNSLYALNEFRRENRNQLSDYESLTQQLTEASNYLQEHKPKLTIEYTLNDDEDRLGLELGDRLDVSWKDIQEAVRVVEQTISLRNGVLEKTLKVEKVTL